MIKKQLFTLLLLLIQIAVGEQTRITVWIHGTNAHAVFKSSPPPPTPFNTWSSCPQGLHPLRTVGFEHQMRTIGEELAQQEAFPAKDCYLFGWSGALDKKQRLAAGEQLYHELANIVEDQSAQGNQTFITIITHSHGGNVALNMARALPKDQEPPFTIDRLILLACPVQKETEHLITHPLFTKIYSLHSHRDIVQILDPQGIHPISKKIKKAIQQKSFGPLRASRKKEKVPFFSQRHFKEHPKVVQVHIHWKKTIPWTDTDIAFFPPPLRRLVKTCARALRRPHGMLHNEFVIPSFISKMEKTLNEITLLEKNNAPKKEVDYVLHL